MSSRTVTPGAALALALALASCSGGSDDPSPRSSEPALSARQVCGATLDGAAAKALTTLAGTDRFVESSPQTPQDMARLLVKAQPKARNPGTGGIQACAFSAAGDDGGRAEDTYTEIGLRWYPENPRLKRSVPGTDYRIGAAAKGEDDGAALVFRCTLPGLPEGATGWILASLSNDFGKGQPRESVRAANMRVLHAVARAVADAAECPDADLPAEPDLTPVPA